MKLFDTATQDYLDFTPPPLMRMYVCGITPYDSAHLGHIFTFMTYDLLTRFMEDQGHEVRLVRNITDVDDPLFAKARELQISYTELAERETRSFQTVLQALNFRPAYAEPKASDYIARMGEAAYQLSTAGYAYQLEDDWYFAVDADPEFGSFSGFGERLERNFMELRGGDPGRPGKQNPLDFLLWRGVSDPADAVVWDSPLGKGRPGWHIECSVMAQSLLGAPFDLHGGGADLIFPHHECEIAQTKALAHTALAKLWLHVAPISYLGEKMSKSLGNLIYAKDLLKDSEAGAIRLALLNYHYRIGGEWSGELLIESSELLAKLRELAPRAAKSVAEKLLTAVRTALADDLDTHAIRHALCDFAAQRVSGDEHSGAEAIGQVFSLLGLT